MSERSGLFPVSAAERLDDPERRRWLPPDEILEVSGARAGEVVADVGAGTGFMTLPFAERVGSGGLVYAVDPQQELLERLRAKLVAKPEARVELVAAAAEDTGLPNDGVDLVYFGAVWHELDQHAMVLGEARRIMRTGGRLAIVDFRHDASPPPGPPALHRVALAEVVKTLRRERWKVRVARELGPYSYVVVADLR